MELKLKQSSERRGEQWAWSVWLDGPSRQLEMVDSVTYYLHPTFARPVRVLRNRSEKFRLDERSWGEFTVRARLLRKDGKVLRRSLRLKFGPTEAGTEAPKKREVAVFLSSSVVDWPTALSLREALKDEGITFYSSADDFDLSLPQSIERTIEKSDAVIALISDSTSASVGHEVRVANSKRIPVITITVGDIVAPSFAGASESALSFRLADPNAVGGLTETLVERVLSLSATRAKQASRGK